MKINKILIWIVGIIFLPLQVFSQDLISVKGFGGTGDNRVFKSVIDNKNNVYLVGYFNGTVTADISYTAYGANYDIFVSKYDSAGNLIWFRQIGSTGYDDFPDAVILSTDGSALNVAGGFSGPSCDFGDGYSIANSSTSGTFDAFLISLKTSDGTINSAKSLAYGQGGQRAQSMKIDKNSNLVVIGYVQGNTFKSYFSPTDYITCSGTQNYFILQLNSSFNFNWVKAIVGNDVNNKLFSMDVDTGGYYIAGTNKNTLTLDVATLISQSGTQDMFLYKTDFNGNGQWVRKIKGSGEDVSVNATCDNFGNIYITGYFASTNLQVDSTATLVSTRTITNKGSNDVFYAKYSTSGTLKWFDTEGSTGDDRVTRLSTNGKYIVIAGQYGGSMTIDNSTIIPKGGIDAYGVVHDSSDNFLYAISSGGSLTDVNQTCLIDNKGRYIFIGQSYSGIDYFSTKDSLINPTTSTRDVYIAKYDKSSITFSIDTITCPGATNGGIASSPHGAFYGNKTYLWSMKGNPGFIQTTQNISGLAAGTYYCKITDDLAYSKTDSVTLTDPTSLVVTFNSVTKATCNNTLTGQILITPSGGTSPYSYNWSTLDGSGIVQGEKNQTTLGAGGYTVKVTDYHSCFVTYDTVITEPLILSVSGSVTPVSAPGANDGAITTTITGGTTPYTYYWNPGAETSKDLTGISGGIYTDSVTDANLCYALKSFSVPEPGMLNVDYSIDSVLCNGGSTGSIILTVSGDYPPFMYTWTKSGYGILPDTTKNLIGIAAGNYTVKIKDSKIPVDSVIIPNLSVKEPAVLAISASSASNITCNGACDGYINITVSGGTRPYNFSWTSPDYPSLLLTTKDVLGLCPGTYNVLITDAKGCTKTSSWLITEPPALTICSLVITNVSCYAGTNDGSVSATACGGTPPYTFIWTNVKTQSGVTTSSITGLPAATYELNLKDSKACSVIAENIVTQPDSFSFSPTLTKPNCFGDANGSINLCVTGGNSPYNFSWSNSFNQNGVTCSNNQNLSIGTYSVVITDSKSCPGSHGGMILTQPDTIHITTDAIKNTICNGASDGFILETTTGGTTPYSYFWKPINVFTQNANGLSYGTDTLLVTDNNGCTNKHWWTIVQPPQALSIDTIIKNQSCNNGTHDGSITISISGGFAPYQILWSGGATTATISSLSPGDYSVTVTDAIGCTVTGTYTVHEPAAFVYTPTLVNLKCFNDNTGSINLCVTGNNPPYNFTWSNAHITSDSLCSFNGALPAGLYSVTITDSLGCPGSYSSMNISQPDSISITTSAIKDSICFGASNGFIQPLVTGGTISVDYDYNWNPTNEITKNISNLGQGTYTLTVTDNNSCTNTHWWTIVQPPQALSIDTIIKNQSCNNGTHDGSITISISGGFAPYQILWSGGETTATISSLSPGNYSVTVTDAIGCTVTGTYTVHEPAAFGYTPTLVNLKCFNDNAGSINLCVTGNNPPYNFTWSNAHITSDSLCSFNGALPAGLYSVTITDSLGCPGSYSPMNISQPDSISITTSAIKDSICFGASNGFIQPLVTGGTVSVDYDYNWNPTNEITKNISNLGQGTYTLTVTDNNSCTNTHWWTIVQPPQALSIDTIIKNQSCNNGTHDGSITISISGGFAPYQILWSGGATTATISSLSPGDYSVTVTDAIGCTVTGTYTVHEPAAFVYTPTLVNLKCFNDNSGSINLCVTGNNPPYNFTWSNGHTTSDSLCSFNGALPAGLYSVTITDSLGCPGSYSPMNISQPDSISITTSAIKDSICFGASNGFIQPLVTGGTVSADYDYNWNPTNEITKNISNLGQGTYTLTVTDNHSCTNTHWWTIVQPPQALSIDTIIKNQSCNNGTHDGSITISISGGFAPYQILWSGGATTATISSLSPGDYSVTVTDAIGCTVTGTYTVKEPAAFVYTPTLVNLKCFNDNTGSINLCVTGNNPPYNFTWSNAQITSDSLCSFNGALPAGLYSVTITDSLGCPGSYSPMNISQPDSISITTSAIKDSICFGASNGFIQPLVTGGTISVDYEYNWNPTNEITKNISNLGQGTYTLTVTDNNSCTNTHWWTIVQPPQALSIDTIIKNQSCNNGTHDGSITISISGGFAPYQILWSGGETTATISSLSPGNYSVTVTDAIGCTTTGTYTVNQPAAFGYTSTLVNLKCYNDNTGSINLCVAGNNPPYNFTWSNAHITSDSLCSFNGDLPAGLYSVTITDNLGCPGSYSPMNIIQPDSISITTSAIKDSICFGASNGFIQPLVTGGTVSADYDYNWNPTNEITKNISNLGQGTYTLTVTDNNSCNNTHWWTIVQPPQALSIDTIIKNQSCNNGTHDGSITISISGGFAPYQILWSGGATTATISSLSPGDYSVTVTDAIGCTVTGTYTVHEPAAFGYTPTLVNLKCFNDNTGSINLCVTGNNPPYNFTWSNGHITSDSLCSFNGVLPAGLYSVTITDSLGCPGSYSPMNISQPDSISITTNAIKDSVCYGACDGFIQPSISGGTSPYDYNWKPTNEITKNISSLCQGTDTLLVTDNNGCTNKHWWTIVQPPQALSIDTIIKNQSCNNGTHDGSITISISGGFAPYQILWSGGETTATISSLSPGNYSVTVTDAIGCTVTGTYTVNQPAAFGYTPTLVNLKCFNDNSGSINLCVTGNNPPYNFTWSNGHTTSDSLCSFNGALPAGLYSVTITDNLGCPGSYSPMNISQPDSISITTSAIKDSICFGAANGLINPSVSGGDLPYSYNWSTGATTINISGLGQGTYTLTVTDNKSCNKAHGWTINQAPAIVIDSAISIHDTIYIFAKGGYANFTYTLDSISNTTGIFALSCDTQSHYIKVTDNLSTCYSDTNIKMICTGILKIKSDQELLLYPNPFRNEFILEISSAKTARYTVEIMNMIGQMVYTRNIETSVGAHVQESFEMTGFPSGIYLFKLRDSTGSVIKRILKQ